MNERQRRIYDALRDEAIAYRYAKEHDPALEVLAVAVDKIFDTEMQLMRVVVRDPKTGRMSKYEPETPIAHTEVNPKAHTYMEGEK